MPAGEAGGEAADALGGALGGGGEGGGAEGGGGDDSALLAVPPGSRNSPRLKPKLHGGENSNSKKVYYPAKRDRRVGTGPRTRSMASTAGQKHSRGHRNVFPGGSDIANIAKTHGIAAGIMGEEQSIYSLREATEENKLFEINESVRVLIENLEDMEKDSLEKKNESKA